MIRIDGNKVNINSILNLYNIKSIERNILEILYKSSENYTYSSEEDLRFELFFRKNTVQASLDLYKSNFNFKIFRKSKCNTMFWERTKQGGFLLKSDALPSNAINDIYKNGELYGTECATAIVIVYYKACLDSLGEKTFNDTFPKIYLMNWHYVDENLGLDTTDYVEDLIPGDCRYFKNPDVNPMTPQWQGENVIFMGNGLFYGHGIGIKTGDEIISKLNSVRIAGANESAYLLDSATRPNFKRLFYIYSKSRLRI
ncbi:protein-glutamine gamma-glutamyltransferase [Clostridium sp.]|jgi:protein-glutamine gamma-glutamyltransferase|uniref:protein-glutamine gamma-glutamyltransferase n=1 Tax=Clostridium sp. TaxID=1506 RepID=UPI003A5C75DE